MKFYLPQKYRLCA